MKVLKIHSVEVLLSDAEAAAVTFRRLFNGARFNRNECVEGLVLLEDVEHGLTLAQPKTNGSLASHPERLGSGTVLTTVYTVENIEAAKAHLQANGFPIRFEGQIGSEDDSASRTFICVAPEATHGFAVTFIEPAGEAPPQRSPRVMPGGIDVLGLNRVEIVVRDPNEAESTFRRLFNTSSFTPDNGAHGLPLECRVDWEHGLELVHPKSADDLVGRLLHDKGEGAVLTVVFDIANLDDARDFLSMTGFEAVYEADYGAAGPFISHKQIVVRSDHTHGLPVTFMESHLRADN